VPATLERLDSLKKLDLTKNPGLKSAAEIGELIKRGVEVILDEGVTNGGGGSDFAGGAGLDVDAGAGAGAKKKKGKQKRTPDVEALFAWWGCTR
jgi:hypothetical protein